MSTESRRPFSIGPDKLLQMRSATFGAILLCAVAGALWAQNISGRITYLSETVGQLVMEQKGLSQKVERLEWSRGGPLR